MQRIINLLLVLILLNSCDLRTADQYYNLAFDLEEKGEYKKAIEYLDKAIKKKPKFRPALLNRGADKSILGDYKGAIEDYMKIIAFDPDNTMILMNIGNNFKRLEQYEKSVDYYTKALSTKGAIRSDSIFLRIHLYNEWDTDSDYFVRKYEIQYERGISYMYLKEYRLAIEDLEQSIMYNHELPDAQAWIGEAYYHLNDTINARKFLGRASDYGIIDAEEWLEKLHDK